MASASGILAGQAFISLSIDNSKLKQGTEKASSILQDFANSSTSLFQNIVGIHYTLANVIRPVVDVFAQFDDQMRLTQAVTGATGEQFKLLTDRAKQLGRDTAFTASEVASGMTSLGRMGFSSTEIDKAISSVMDLSRATGTDLAVSADIAANSLRMFGLESTEMARTADILTATANGSAQTLTDLFEALKMAGPQAATAKESLTDVSAAIGIMANVGIKGSLAGTALRRAYVNMASSKVQDFLKQYNIQTVDATGNLRKMKDIIMDVGRVMQDMGTAEKMSFAEDVFDMRGSFVGLSLGGNVKGMQQFIEKLEQAEDVAAKTAATMESGMGGAVRMMKSAFEAVIIAIGESIDGFVLFGAKFATGVLRGITNFITATPQLATAITGVAAATIPLAAGLMGVVLSMKALSIASNGCTAAIGGVQKAFTMLGAHPIIAALALAATAITYHVARLRTMAAEIKNAKNKQEELNWELEKQAAIVRDTQKSATAAASNYNRLTELAEISRRQRLNNSEILEADALIQRLDPYGSAYYAQLDAVAGSLTLATDAQRQFNKAINTSQIPALEEERDKILEKVKAIEAERDALIKRNGARAVMRNQVAEEQAQARIEAQMVKVTELQARIDELKKPIVLDIRTSANLPPSIADLEKAAKTLAELEEKMAEAGKTEAQRKEDELNRQNELYREQIGLLTGVAEAKAAQARQAVAELEARKDTAEFDTVGQRISAHTRTTILLNDAKERQEFAAEDVAGWRRWKREGNELFDEGKMVEAELQLFAADEEVKKLQARLDELNSSQTTADIQLKIDAELVNLEKAEAEIKALQKRRENFESQAASQREAIRRKEASSIMADIARRDRERQIEQENDFWQSGIDDLFKSSSIAQAVEKATLTLNIERENETRIRSELAAAQEKNEPESLRKLADELQRSQSRQDYIMRAVASADAAQKDAESVGRNLPRENIASFVTSDILNLLGNPSGPEEETARNTRATANNLARLIDIVRSRKTPTFS